MKSITPIVNNPAVKTPIGSDQITKEQAGAVGYFFARLQVIDSGQYHQLIPDPATEQVVKREYAAHLMNFSKDQIDKGLAQFHQLRPQGNLDYKFMNVDRIIGLMNDSNGARAGMYKSKPPELPEPPDVKQARKAKGRDVCGSILSDLLGDCDE